MPSRLWELADVDLTDGDDELPLFDALQDLPFDETATHYYIGGVDGSLGLHKCTGALLLALDMLENDDEPNTRGYNEVDMGPDLLITAFSDEEDSGDEIG
ncbi:hypothetical protein PAXRUDRAFT_143737 [Paxillus rubicundulus Ve08.2h10]|uniref:Uncharacterized protein n=1 Tax=Paxillus rubicundulus Ve08.2h10 TaxID=930991 RepID=A0A0D0E1C3_9AGAM|nr:hypothetical protein PAXRUDRAFT_143737 [Paxillus rubicundulus Ve08.2h10]